MGSRHVLLSGVTPSIALNFFHGSIDNLKVIVMLAPYLRNLVYGKISTNFKFVFCESNACSSFIMFFDNIIDLFFIMLCTHIFLLEDVIDIFYDYIFSCSMAYISLLIFSI